MTDNKATTAFGSISEVVVTPALKDCNVPHSPLCSYTPDWVKHVNATARQAMAKSTVETTPVTR